MSVPTPLNVVVIGEASDVAGIAASVLRGDQSGSYAPQISAACIRFSEGHSPFLTTADGRRIKINIATFYQVIDARRVDLWLTLDATAAERARIYIMHNGPPPNNFYRGVFPDPVIPCGFEISYLSSSTRDFAEQLNFLAERLKPWRERIWDAYRDSS